MDKSIGAQEVIKLKKQYGTGGDDKAISQQAETIRQQYGLDDSKYGSGVSIADAYMNYHNEFGQSQVPKQQQEVPTQPQFNQEQSLLGIQNMLQENSDAYLAEQTANFENQLSQQIAQLESTYAEAVAQGEMSVREAEQAFQQQKVQIEKQAYVNNEALKVHAQSRGIQNSQQLIGLEQGADSRNMSLVNSSISERDKRINDIKDRISMLNTQKGIAMTQAQNEYGYNVASAQAQANQMYNQSMSNLMSQDYFTQMGMQHDTNMMNSQQEFTREQTNIQNAFAKELASFQNSLDIQKMYVGRDINIEVMEKEMATQLSNQLTIMERDYGYKSSLSAQEQRNAISRIASQASAQAKAAIDAADEARKLEAQKLGLDINASHNEIYEKQKQEADNAIIRAAATDAYGNHLANTVFNNPALELNPTKPTEHFGPFNILFGTKGKTETYNQQTSEKSAAQKAVDKKLKELGLPSMYGN